MLLLLSALALAAPISPALPDANLATVREAGGQLFWASYSASGTVSLHTRPTPGGAVRSLGTVKTGGESPSVAFDGTTYAVAFSDLTGVDTTGEDCGVCESDLSYEEQVVTGTLAGAPQVVATCTARGWDVPAARVAVAAGRPFFTDACQPGIRSSDGTFDADGRLPLRGAGTWLSYARPGAVRVLDLVGGGSYTVPAAPAGADALSLQADGSILLGSALYRTGGTTAPVALHPAWTDPDPDALLASDRLFYGDLSTTSAQGTSAIVVPGLGAKRALSLAGSTVTVAGALCTGEVTVQAVDLTPSGAVDGCPVEVMTRTLRLKRNRTITVAARCANGCRGTLTLLSGDVSTTATLRAAPGARATVRFRLTRTAARQLRRTARFGSAYRFLTVKGSAHRIRRPVGATARARA